MKGRIIMNYSKMLFFAGFFMIVSQASAMENNKTKSVNPSFIASSEPTESTEGFNFHYALTIKNTPAVSGEATIPNPRRIEGNLEAKSGLQHVNMPNVNILKKEKKSKKPLLNSTRNPNKK
jgi:hypothetical protein